jgi:hypothetical protein
VAQRQLRRRHQLPWELGHLALVGYLARKGGSDDARTSGSTERR